MPHWLHNTTAERYAPHSTLSRSADRQRNLSENEFLSSFSKSVILPRKKNSPSFFSLCPLALLIIPCCPRASSPSLLSLLFHAHFSSSSGLSRRQKSSPHLLEVVGQSVDAGPKPQGDIAPLSSDFLPSSTTTSTHTVSHVKIEGHYDSLSYMSLHLILPTPIRIFIIHTNLRRPSQN